MKQSYDIAIIGGGIIGSALAALLAKENLKTVLIDSSSFGLSASVAAAGLLTPFQHNEAKGTVLKSFCYEAFKYYPYFLEMITDCKANSQIDIGYREAGSLYLVFSNFEFSKKDSEYRQNKELDPNISFLNKAEVFKHEPLITREIFGAYHYPKESYLNNPRLLKAITSFCVENKVEIKNCAVNNINIQNNIVQDIKLDNQETVSAGKYVLCNGAWANLFLKRILGVNDDFIKPIKGEILQIEPVKELSPLQKLQKIIFCEDGYILPRALIGDLEPFSILVGSTSVETGINKENFYNSTNGTLQLLNLLQKILPLYSNYKIKNLWSGLRPQTQDNIPVIGRIDEIKNLYCSIGHYRNGILTAPYSGKILKEIICDNANYNEDVLGIQRFLNKNLKAAIV